MSESSEASDPALTATRPRGPEPALDPASAVALVLSAIWVLGTVSALMFLPSGNAAGFNGLNFIVAIVAVVLPVAMIWVSALSARAARTLREESERLSAAVDAIRASAIQQTQAAGSGIRAPVEAKLDEIARAQRQAEAALARLTQGGGAAIAPMGTQPRAERIAPARKEAPAAQQESAQPRLALGPPEDQDGEPIPNEEFIRALNFPEDERDAAGFHALRLALKDHFSAGLIRSSQDVLTLLSEDGIYMDDLTPDLARPEVWRRFAQGERGKGIAALGGVRDRSCLSLAAGRMRQDPVFRDVAHHFLRKFDHTIAEFEPRAADADFVALADTRTARAFMLLGRVAGTFD
ncbi:MAG: hypothetical protein AAGJ91_11320 [Pseudomonadota bacterium]